LSALLPLPPLPPQQIWPILYSLRFTLYFALG
jgi:hypothetical protein